MKRTHLAIAIVGVSVLLAAEPVCHVLQTAVKKHYSQKTLDAWAVWRHDHPTWAPKSRKETLAALNFACSPVVTLDAETTELLTAPEIPAPLDVAAVEVDAVAPDAEIMASLPENPSGSGYVAAGYPFQMPYLFFTGAPSLPPKHCKRCKEPPPPMVAPVPEPASSWLLLTGLLAVGLVRRRVSA